MIRQLAVAGVMVSLCVLVFGIARRWANPANRSRWDEPASVTLSDFKATAPQVPLDLADPVNKDWLRANLLIEDGSLLVSHSDDAAGNVNDFHLPGSNPSVPGGLLSVTTDHGVLNIKPTIIPWEFRSDVPDSGTRHPSYHPAELRGLVWKVVDSRSNFFDLAQGNYNILNSTTHPNSFSIYACGTLECERSGDDVFEDSTTQEVIVAGTDEGRLVFGMDSALWNSPYRMNPMTYSMVPR